MVVYLFNSFSQEVMENAVVNLRKIPLEKVYMIYKAPIALQFSIIAAS